MLSILEKLIFLKEIPFFRGLDVDQLRVIAAVCKEQLLLEDTIVFREGDPGGSLYVIVSGRVELEQTNKATGVVKKLGTLEMRQYFGEESLFDKSPRTARATAVQDTLTLQLSYEPLIVLLNQKPEMALQIIKVLSQRLRESEAQLADLARTRSRVMHKVFDKLG